MIKNKDVEEFERLAQGLDDLVKRIKNIMRKSICLRMVAKAYISWIDLHTTTAVKQFKKMQ
ncbi:hypothetical protein BCR21_00210 [Enterococcus ureasiticus]|uniref:Uncharacterized protein n=1 Tax=Enterococcus ureasiticus TaxID=903984 RepID=A0A1E5GL72_9ENTE|nr:hypothetical protein BCR21_00210 [Enterococcus ureasiticus]